MRITLSGNTASITVNIDGICKRCSKPSHVVDHVTTALVRSGFNLKESMQHGILAARIGRSLVTGQTTALEIN